MTQAMTETDAAVDQTVQEEGASDDLDSLLNEYTQETKPEPTIDQKDVTEAVNWIKEERTRKVEESVKNDLESAVKNIGENLDLDVKPSSRTIRGLLRDIAEDDPAIQKAFAQRESNPQAWAAAQKRALGLIKEELSIDQQTTQDRNAITSAVLSASNQKPTPEKSPDLSAMSDAEFQRYKFGLSRGN
jgi:hypothetical protein